MGFALPANALQCWFLSGKLQKAATGKPCALRGANDAKNPDFYLHCRVGEKVEKAWEAEEEHDETCYKADSE